MEQDQRPSAADIFINLIEKELNSGNLIDQITNHLPNFLLITEKPNNQNERYEGF